VPFAAAGLVKLPAEVTDEQAILLSDIFPTAYFGAKLGELGGRHGGGLRVRAGWAICDCECQVALGRDRSQS